MDKEKDLRQEVEFEAEELQNVVSLDNGDEDYEEIDLGALTEMLGQSKTSNEPYFQPIDLDLEEYNMDEFDRGISEISYVCGQITALLNTGVSESFVLEYMVGRDAIQGNIQINRENNEAQIEISKNQRVLVERQEI